MDTSVGHAVEDHFGKLRSSRGIGWLDQSYLRKLAESDLFGIGIPDRFGAFIEGNDELLRITGYTREDLEAGRVRWDIMTPPEYQELDAAHIAEAAQRGSCTPYEKEYIRKDGTRVPILCGYALLEGSQDEYIGFVQDLTVQKRAEAALRESEAQFRTLTESLPQLIWVADTYGDKTYCNQKYLHYTGIESPEELSRAWTNLIHPDDRLATVEAWEHALAQGEIFSRGYRLRRHDGVYRHHLGRAVPMKDDSGHIKLWMGSITDVHDEKQGEEVLRRTEKLAAAGRLAASIAHEINNPLESVMNCLYLALQDEQLSDVTRHYLKLADQELSRVSHVTTQTLRFYRQSRAPSQVSIQAKIDALLTVFAHRIKSSGIVVERQYQATPELLCAADEMRQAFAHILSNSLDAMPRGGTLKIRIRHAHSWDATQTDGIRVTIADTGDGIPVALMPHVFEAFTTTREPVGTGLGLWVVEGVVRKHQGRIALRSSTGNERHGTTLSMFLPCLDNEDANSGRPA